MKLLRHSLVAILSVAVLAGCDDDDDPFVPPEPEPVEHTFVFEPHEDTPAITSINVAGSFAEEGEEEFWNPELNAMTQQADGTWELTKTLEPGTYEYKYVFNGDQWPPHMCEGEVWGNPPGGPIDPNVQECNEDGFGGANAVLVIE